MYRAHHQKNRCHTRQWEKTRSNKSKTSEKLCQKNPTYTEKTKFNQNFSPFIWNFSLIFKNTPIHCQELRERENRSKRPKSYSILNAKESFSQSMRAKFSTSRTIQMTFQWELCEIHIIIYIYRYFFYSSGINGGSCFYLITF